MCHLTGLFLLVHPYPPACSLSFHWVGRFYIIVFFLSLLLQFIQSIFGGTRNMDRQTTKKWFIRSVYKYLCLCCIQNVQAFTHTHTSLRKHTHIIHAMCLVRMVFSALIKRVNLIKVNAFFFFLNAYWDSGVFIVSFWPSICVFINKTNNNFLPFIRKAVI